MATKKAKVAKPVRAWQCREEPGIYVFGKRKCEDCYPVIIADARHYRVVRKGATRGK